MLSGCGKNKKVSEISMHSQRGRWERGNGAMWMKQHTGVTAAHETMKTRRDLSMLNGCGKNKKVSEISMHSQRGRWERGKTI
jgi:hypothetical protein